MKKQLISGLSAILSLTLFTGGMYFLAKKSFGYDKPKISIETSSDGDYGVRKIWYNNNLKRHMISLSHDESLNLDIIQNINRGDDSYKVYVDKGCDGDVERVSLERKEGNITRDTEYTKEIDGESSPYIFEEADRESARIKSELLPYLNQTAPTTPQSSN